MRVNLPVTQREYDYPADRMLVSMTDSKGVITHCNHAFVETSGFTYEELIGQNHNLVRHPDMPPAAYRDMWNTIGHGQYGPTGFCLPVVVDDRLAQAI